MGSWEVLNLSSREIRRLVDSLPPLTEEEMQALQERYSTAMKELRASATSVEEAQSNLHEAIKEASSRPETS